MTSRNHYGPGTGELFAECAAPEAIAARLKAMTAQRDRYARWVERLEQLHARRVAEKANGTWPPAQVRP